MSNLTPAENPKELAALCKTLLAMMKKRGADEAEVMLQHSIGTTLKVREGRVDEVRMGEGRGVGLRFFHNKRLAEASSTDLSMGTLEGLVDRCARLVDHVKADPHHILSPPEKGHSEAHLKGYTDDFSTISQREKNRRLFNMEKTALSHKGISHTDGATYSENRTSTLLYNSLGLGIKRQRTTASVAIGVYAIDDQGNRQVAWEGTAARSYKALGDWQVLASRASDQALTLLGAAPMPTGKYAVVFSNEESGVLFNGLLGAMKGSRLAKKSTYLQGKVGKRVAGKNITLLEDPFIPGAMASGAWDGEGSPKTRKLLVDSGILQGFVYNNYYAHKMKTRTTGNASRGGYGGSIGIGFSNVVLEGSKGMTGGDVISDTREGLYVMGTMGFGVNPVTGDLSLGAIGRRIRNGRLEEPVSQVTIAGKLQDLLCNIDLIADDPRKDGTLWIPTLRVQGMVVAGK